MPIMRLRDVGALTLLWVLGGLLVGCGSPSSPASVRVLSPEDGASLGSQRVTFRAELDVAGEGSPSESRTLRWSFGDGETATGSEVTHIYDGPGSYDVSVAAVDERGESGEPTALTIEVRNAPPAARIQADPSQGNAPLEVAFSAEGSQDPDGSLAAYEWDLGDGSARTGRQVVHTYANRGEYNATLTVRDAQGAEATASTTVEVSRRRSERPSVTWEVRMVSTSDGQAVFDPSVLVIEPGDTVRWTNAAGRHSSTSYSAGLPSEAAPWDTGVLSESGKSVGVTFPEDAPIGSYPYYCRVHRDAGMLGLVVVGEPSELDPEFMASLPELLRNRLTELNRRAEERTGGGSP